MTTSIGEGSSFAEQVMRVVNARRAAMGLRALEPDAELFLIAHAHSQDMAQARRMSHDGFAQRFGRTTSTLCVENLATGFSHPEALVRAWEASPTHHRNLAEPRVWRAGVAQVGRYVTLFACSGP